MKNSKRKGKEGQVSSQLRVRMCLAEKRMPHGRRESHRWRCPRCSRRRAPSAGSGQRQGQRRRSCSTAQRTRPRRSWSMQTPRARRVPAVQWAAAAAAARHERRRRRSQAQLRLSPRARRLSAALATGSRPGSRHALMRSVASALPPRLFQIITIIIII